MGQYSEGFITVPGRSDKAWRTSEGKYLDHRPGLGMNTMGAAGTAFLNMFRPVKQRAFPETFREEYDKDGSYVKPDRSGGFYGPGGNSSGSGMGQAQQNPGIGPYQGHTPGLPRPSQPDVAPRQETRSIPGGGTQDGLKMSGGVSAAFVPEYANSSFNQLLAGVNASGNRPFSSNQLPTTAGSPDSNIGPVTDGVAYADMLQNAPGAGTTGIGPLADGAAYARAVEGKGKSTSRLDAALSDTAGMQSYMSKFSSGDQERAANRAFLDGDGSQAGLRAKEAVNRVVYAGGQHHISGKSGDDQAIAISRSQARDISNGKSSAQSLLAAHIDKNKNAETPVEAQEPITLEKPGVKQSFGRTETISAPIDTSIPDKTAFNSNNGVDVPGFGNTGGYKPTSKKPGVDYSSIFS